MDTKWITVLNACCERMEKENNEKTNMEMESDESTMEKPPNIEGSPKGVTEG
ncbi:hypothetical protein A2U01_0104083, partial [Trifolium medium]|nr:hypothetical protein [Trifolium medium]